MSRVKLALAALTIEKPRPQQMKTIVYDPGKISDPYIYGCAWQTIAWGPKREGAFGFDSVKQARETLASMEIDPDKLIFTPITVVAQSAKPSADWHDTMQNFRL